MPILKRTVLFCKPGHVMEPPTDKEFEELKWTQLSRQKIIVFLTRLKKNFDYLMVTFPAFPPE